METAAFRSRATSWLVFFTVVAALWAGRDLLTMLALAGFIAFVLEPFVRQLTRWRVPRVVGTTLVLGGATLVIVAVGWLLFGQLRMFSDNLPEYGENLRAKVHTIVEKYGDSIERASSTVRVLGGELTPAASAGPEAAPAPAQAPAATSSLGSTATFLQGIIGSIAGFAAWAAFVLLLSWVILLRWDDLRDRGLELAGRSELYVTTRAASEASGKVMGYVRKQLLVNVLHGTAVCLLLAWVGVPNPLVWGILAAGLRFLPYVGPAISIVAPLAVSLASTEGWTQTWLAAAALIGLEVITNNVVEPLVYGKSTGISTLALLVSAAFWTWIWGSVGLILSVPLAVCLLVIGRHFPRLRFLEILISDRPALPESSRLYHRMLAGAQDEAWELLRRHVGRDEETLEADGLLLSALGMAGQGVLEGTLDPEQRALVAHLTRELVGELTDARTPAEPATSTAGPRILCVGARDDFDAFGSALLAAELERRGANVALAGEGELLSETLSGIRADPPGVVCVSSVAPTHFLQVRALCKRLLKSNGELAIVLCLWDPDLEPSDFGERLPVSDRVHVATSLREAADRAVALASARPVEPAWAEPARRLLPSP